MRVLGAILAGGASRRFGSDKAIAQIGGRPMLAHIAERLAVQSDGLVIVGRDWPGIERVDDRPAPRLGPLGGLAGALAYATAQGFDAVLTSACDLPDLPLDLRTQLDHPNALLRGQPTLGLWDAALANPLVEWLAGNADRSIRAWAVVVGAHWVHADEKTANINTPVDLAAFRLSADPRSLR
jgi:molybdopterin-guanine dinucleotide biosynthesis protein A